MVVCELALSVLVFRITASPLLGALTFALGLLPYAVGGPLLSAVADRCPARRVLVVCDLLCALAAAGMVLPGTPVAVLLVLTGTGISYNFGVDRWFVAAVPEELLGQAMTVMHAGRMTVMGLAGAAAQWAPLRVVMPAAGVVGAVCVLAVICEVRRTGPGPDRASAGPVRGGAGPGVRGEAGPVAGTEK